MPKFALRKLTYMVTRIQQHMRKELFIPICLMSLLYVVSCRQEPKSNISDSIAFEDSTELLSDTTLCGHMGEGTSMNVIEFITETGDTLYLSKEESNAKEHEPMLGDMRNGTDLFIVTTRIARNNNEAVIGTCINVTQLMGVWKNGNERLALYADGSADNDARNLNNWQIVNGELVLTLGLNTEYGSTQRNDTLKLLELSDNELVYANRHGQTFKFTK